VAKNMMADLVSDGESSSVGMDILLNFYQAAFHDQLAIEASPSFYEAHLQATSPGHPFHIYWGIG